MMQLRSLLTIASSEDSTIAASRCASRSVSLAVADVTGNLRRPDNRAVVGPDWRHGERHLDEGAVLAAADGLEVFNPNRRRECATGRSLPPRAGRQE